MTKEEAISTLMENICMSCAYDAECMDKCDIRGCDNRDAIKVIIGETEQHRWIPVTERLPEEDGDYLVTTSSFYGTTIFVTTRHFNDGEWNYDRAVTAWMPLPKPYEGSETE